MIYNSSDKFDKFCTSMRRAKNLNYNPPAKLLALDPGETTGMAIFEHGLLTKVEQLETKTIEQGVDAIADLIVSTNQVVYEDYKVYGWKTDSHAFASLHTPQLIGAIRTLAHQQGVNIHTQMAQQAKNFCTDSTLKGWDYYSVALKHGRDAVRHGCYYLLFNHDKAKS